jgi:pSer/pThr/pTyr-binding forkhead associated (FHA) protein
MQSGVSYRLTVRQGPIPGKVIELAKDVLVIGRDVNNDVVVNDAEVSRTHARLTLQGDGYLVEDLASTNGTFINGQRLTTPRLLRSGDMLGMGETVVMEFGAIKTGADATVVAASSFSYPSPAAPAASSPADAGPRPPTAPLGSAAPQPAPSMMFNPSSAPAEPPTPDLAPPKKDNRMLIIGGVCGCLTLCLCIALIAGAWYAYSNGMLRQFGF